MSMYTLPTKIGIMIATSGAGFGLALIGFEANVAQTPEVLNNMMNIICFIPAGSGLVAFLVMLFYSLTDDRLHKIMESNAAKKAIDANV